VLNGYLAIKGPRWRSGVGSRYAFRRVPIDRSFDEMSWDRARR